MTKGTTKGWTPVVSTQELNAVYEGFFGPTMKKAEEALGRNQNNTSFTDSLNSNEMESIFNEFFGDPLEAKRKFQK